MLALQTHCALLRRSPVRAAFLALSVLVGCHAAHAEGTGKPPTPHPSAKAPKPVAAKKPSATGRAKPSAHVSANATSPLGTNLDGINDWSSDFPFVDALKRSRAWISSTETQWEDQRTFTLDERGFPRSLAEGQRARTLIWWDLEHYPAGDYVVLYEGVGALSYAPQGELREKRAGREVVHVDPKKGFFGLIIEAIPKPASYLKNVHVLMPGGVCDDDPVRYCDAQKPCAGRAACTPFEQNYETQIFHPKFLERLQKFSVVRFMDWMRTNDSKERKWADRPLPTDVRFRDGAPVETMVALANRLSQHPWFNIPHAADDDYVRQFASYVRDHLRPELKVYVEYSNEVWNGIFPQAAYATEQGKKLGLGKSNWDAQYRFQARRSTEVQKIWEAVFKGQEKRLVRVLGTQVANEGVAEALLSFEDTREHVDALAVAPYFGGEYGAPEETKRWENASVTQVLADLRARSLPTSYGFIKRHAEIAKKYQLELVAYEGGESFAGIGGSENNPKLNKLFDAVGRDPRMKQIYLEYLAGWKNNGGKLFVHFTDCFVPGKFGRWGALEYLEQPRAEAPKFDALQSFIEKNPRWW